MIRYTDQITPEEYMELRKKAGWTEFPAEEAKTCIENAYMVLCVRDDERAVGVARLLWDGGYIAFLSDVIVDIVESGRTLKENGLEPATVIADLSCRLVCNNASLKTKYNEISNIVSGFENILKEN